MDDPEMGPLKIAEILPEFHEGGVERHVLWLSNALAGIGHQVTVITAGGKLEGKLDTEVEIWRLPVHRKNPVTGLYSALKIACRAKRERWNILHAHSRVPAWIAWWASSIADVPWVFTAHARYSLNKGLKPFPRANGAICISRAVEKHLEQYLPDRRTVIMNGLPPSELKWENRGEQEKRFLFVGRLTRIKGLHFVIEALGGLKNLEWKLDVIGDGPQREELEALSEYLGLSERVHFHGFRDDPQEWMARSDLLLFPSLDEGMGLVLMQAIQVGIPVLASDIEPVREVVGENAPLITPGDVGKWRQRIEEIIKGEENPPPFDIAAVPSVQTMTASVLRFFHSVVEP